MSDVLVFIGFIIVGVIGGIVANGIEKEMFGEKATRLESLVPFIIEIFLFISMLFLHIIIHECGHLIFGLISGYRFSSFMVANVMLLNDNGKLKLKKYHVPGAGGQCLMIPPKDKGDEVPFVLYNLGGVLMNFITAMLGTVIYILCDGGAIVNAILINFSSIGFLLTLHNGIPMRTKQLANDGMNILKLKKNPKARKAFANTLYIYEQTIMKKRLREMPEEYFEIDLDSGEYDSVSASIFIYRFMRLMDLGEFDEAIKLGEYILQHTDSMIGIHKNTMKLEIMYCRILLDYSKEKINEIYEDKEVEAFLKVAGKMISTPRYQYAHALLVEEDEGKAEKYYNDFYKVMEKYPYKADAKMEEELLLRAKKKHD